MNLIKKIILLLIVLTTIKAAENTITPRVDERAELLSIVFRLSGADEYGSRHFKTYTSKIDSYFEAVKDHQITTFVQSLRESNGVGYDAVMSMAICLKIEDEKLTLRDDIIESSLDGRWEDETSDFLELLNDFYKKSEFKKFFNSNIDIYKKAELNFKKILDEVDFNWFEKFYREKENGDFNLILSMSNGPSNYGPKLNLKNNSEEIYAIIGTTIEDEKGYPDYNFNIFSTLIHEFNHSFSNPIVEKNYSQLMPIAEKFYKVVNAEMARQAYGSAKTMMYELFVRASVIRYLIAHIDDKITPEAIESEISREKARGFLTIDKFVELLEEYENGDYKNLSEFIPKIVELHNNLSPEDIKDELRKGSPKLVKFNIENEDDSVDFNITEIILTFDTPMHTKSNGCTYGNLGSDGMPIIKSAKWNEDSKTEWILTVELVPNKEYSISFPSQWFIDSNKKKNLYDSYILNFKTRSE
ncbi:MAG: DUF4932 domain-containing protein [Candidatus Delongbacteria bacterium]|nr:DUF4932 domain-containing protein [Candidatus Delongbacteria bacterium]MBN2834147.1 DUF4932 domain-containing protein [Candidatus Delongbacteria bacterium]